MILNDGDLLRDELLDIYEELEVIMFTKGVGNSSSTCSTGTSDTMDIGLRDIRDIIVDHIFQSVDIDPTRGDIRRDEDTGFLRLEVRECALTIVLGLISMDCLGRYTLLDEEPGDLIRSVFCLGKDEHIFDLGILQDMYHEWIFVHLIHMIDVLCDRLSGRRYWCDLYLEWIF